MFDRNLGQFGCLGDGQAPRTSSHQLDWRGFMVEHHDVPSIESRELIWMKHVVGVTLNNALTLERWTGNGYAPAPSRAGHVCMVPSGAETRNRASGQVEVVCVAFDPTFFAVACGEILGGADLQLREEYGIEDAFISGACKALNRESELGGITGRLYSESLATSLAVHLVVRYAGNKQAASSAVSSGGGLSPKIARQTLELIEARLAEDLSLNEMAGAVRISPFHFARQFKKSLGLSPHQFVLKQRVERAKKYLMRGKLPMAEVALEVGFCDQSHFAMHFKRLAGMTPREFVQQVRSR